MSNVVDNATSMAIKNNPNRPSLWQVPTGTIAPEKIQELTTRLRDIVARGQVAQQARRPSAQGAIIKIANSLSAEDMVIMHHWLRGAGLSAAEQGTATFFMLETGRLPSESLAYLEMLKQHYGVAPLPTYPDKGDVAAMIQQYGLNGFYDSLVARKACCGVRKVAPLKNMLAGAVMWVTGQRRGQGETRQEINFHEDDRAFGLDKYNPLFDWSEGEVFAYLADMGVPLHPLYQRGYASIGCDPCSRAIKAGEPPRAGRWWWEDAINKECGINEINMKNN